MHCTEQTCTPRRSHTAIYSEENVPDGSSKTRHNPEDPNKGHDHTFFIQLSRDVIAG
jgi:hypothetical protein